MNLKLSKKSIKNLSNKARTLPAKATPAVAGGFGSMNVNSCNCDKPTTDPLTYGTECEM